MGKLTFVTGPVRSGKSRFALGLARGWGDGVVFAATYRADSGDGEMQARIRRHREERPAAWRTLEAPDDLPRALAELDPPPGGVVLDCLTLWLGGRMEASDETILAEWRRLLDHLRRVPYPSVIVSNEVGWSLVPAHPDSRRFRDLAGWLGQAAAAEADEAWLCVAGCPVRLKPA